MFATPWPAANQATAKVTTNDATKAAILRHSRQSLNTMTISASSATVAPVLILINTSSPLVTPARTGNVRFRRGEEPARVASTSHTTATTSADSGSATMIETATAATRNASTVGS